jgi:hypothetical protein
MLSGVRHPGGPSSFEDSCAGAAASLAPVEEASIATSAAPHRALSSLVHHSLH